MDPVSRGEKVLNIRANKEEFCVGRNRKRINDRLRERKERMKAILTGDLIKHTHVAMTSTDSLSASLPGTLTHSQSNPRFKEAVLHIADS